MDLPGDMNGADSPPGRWASLPGIAPRWEVARPGAWASMTGTGLVGMGAGTLAVLLGESPLKYGVAVFASIILAIAFLLLRDTAQAERLLVALFALSIPFDVQINFLYYRQHVGGAPGITVTLSLLTAAALLWLGATRPDSRRPASRVPTWAFLAFPALYLLAGILSLLNAEHAGLVLFECLRMLSLIVVCLAFLNLRDRGAIQTFVATLALGLLIEGVLAVLQHKFNLSIGRGVLAEPRLSGARAVYEHTLSRATGTIGHPNVLGYYFEILVPLALGVFLTESRPAWKAWWLAAFGAGMFGIVATLSRGAWVTLLFSLPLVVLLSLRGRLLSVKTALGVTLVTLCGVLFVALVYRDVERRILRYDHQSMSSRMPLNEAAFSIVEQHPIVGIGLNNFAESFKKHDLTGNSRVFKGYRQVVHNMYLLVWAEIGTVGLLAFLGMVLVPIGMAMGHVFRVPIGDRGILAGVAAGMGAHMLHGLFDPGFRTQLHISVLLFSLMGLVGAVVQLAGPVTRGEAARVS